MLSAEDELRHRFPLLKMTVHTVDAGHHVHLDAPEQVAALIAKR
jgi:pimeloyl-ACP methyl ester carboxylesterase